MDLLLPGPPLAEWLLAVSADKKMALWTGPDAGRGRAGRAARTTVNALRAQLGWVDPGGATDGVVVVVALGGAEPPDAILSGVRAGGPVIELAHVPPVPLWPGKWAARGELVRRASELRAGAMLRRGCFAVEQWVPLDVPRLLVTSARVRAISSA
ncbi:MAG TPA: hypothetical protein VIK91_07925 [Nannocystis sp.]